MTEESDLKRELIDQCRKQFWYARRLEDQYAVGVLDIVIVPRAYPTLFVEAKVTDGLKFAPTERQYIEGTRIIGARGGAFPMLIGWRSKVMYISNGWLTEDYITRAFKQPSQSNYAQTIEEWLRWKIKQLPSAS